MLLDGLVELSAANKKSPCHAECEFFSFFEGTIFSEESENRGKCRPPRAQTNGSTTMATASEGMAVDSAGTNEFFEAPAGREEHKGVNQTRPMQNSRISNLCR